MLTRSMLLESNAAALDMAKKLEKEEKAAARAHQRQQHQQSQQPNHPLRTPPSSPGSKLKEKLKLKRGFWGSSFKNLPIFASPGGDRTETTEDETQQGEDVELANHHHHNTNIDNFNDSMRSQDPPGASARKLMTLSTLDEQPKLVKKSRAAGGGRTRKKGKSKSLPSDAVQQNTAEPEKRRMIDVLGILAPGARSQSASPRKAPQRQRRLGLSRSGSVPEMTKGGTLVTQKEKASPRQRRTGLSRSGSVPEFTGRLPLNDDDHHKKDASASSPSKKLKRRTPSRSSSVPKFMQLGDGLSSLSGKDTTSGNKKPPRPHVHVSAKKMATIPAASKGKLHKVNNNNKIKNNSNHSNGKKQEDESMAPVRSPTPREKQPIWSKVKVYEAAVEATNPEHPHCGTLVETKSIDEVTCLTMDDFKIDPKETIKSPRGSNNTHRFIGKKKGALLNDMDRSGHKDPLLMATSAAGHLSDAGLAEILRKDIHSKKEPVLIAGLDAIKEFASMGSKQRTKVCAFGAIPSIIRVLESKKMTSATQNLFLSAVGALEKVTAKSARNQHTACELGCIPSIALGIQRNLAAPHVVGAACKTLDSITTCLRLDSETTKDKYAEIPTEGAMTVLSCCLMTHTNDKDVVAYGIGTITNICLYRKANIQMLSEAGGIAAMQSLIVPKKKWKSKTRKTRAVADLEIIQSWVGNSSSSSSSDEESSESSDEEAEQEASRDKTFDSL